MAVQTSNQAITKERRPHLVQLTELVRAYPHQLDQPRIITADGEVWPDETGVVQRLIQNCGVDPVYYQVGNTTIDSLHFHGVLAGGVAQDDGKGGQVDLSRIPGRVTIKAVTGTPRVATIRVRDASSEKNIGGIP